MTCKFHPKIINRGYITLLLTACIVYEILTVLFIKFEITSQQMTLISLN